MVTRPQRECRQKQLSKREGGETDSSRSEAPQCKGFHCRCCCWSGEWLAEECQAHGVWTKRFTPLFTRICNSQRSHPGGWQTAGKGNEEGGSQDVRGVHSDNHCCFLTILDNVLTVGKYSGGEAWVGRPHPHPGDLLEEARGGCEKSHVGRLCWGASAVIQALC